MHTAVNSSSEGMKARFLEHLPALKEAIRTVSKRRRLTAEESAELASSVFLKLIEDDYAVLKQVRNDGQLRSFLFSVVNHHLLDRRNHEWGKWRPSQRAKQLGSAAVFLERLIVRDRIELQQAVGVLAHHPRWELSSQDVRGLHAQLDRRVPRARPVNLVALEATLPTRALTPDVELDELRREATRARVALHAAVRSLEPFERRLLRMRFQEGLPICDIAAAIGADAKGLYRRFERILRHLRTQLERCELSRTTINRLVGRSCLEFASRMPASDGAPA